MYKEVSGAVCVCVINNKRTHPDPTTARTLPTKGGGVDTSNTSNKQQNTGNGWHRTEERAYYAPITQRNAART